MPTLQEVFQTPHPVAFVTGSGAPRVGRTIAQWLGRLGCHVALHARESLEQARQAASEMRDRGPGKSMVVQGALEHPDVPKSVVQSVVDEFGRIDILVNSAAIWKPTRLEDVTPELLTEYFDVNARATFLTSQAAGLQMVQQSSGGVIVNLGDWATVRPYLDHAAYFPSKGAVEVMTRSLAVELGTRNPRVRVNCIQPGPVMLDGNADTQYVERIASSTLVKSVGTPQHVAHAVQFLCENTFVTGVCLPVDGGRTIYADDGLQDGLNTG